MKASEILRKARTIIETPERWARNTNQVGLGLSCADTAIGTAMDVGDHNGVVAAQYLCTALGLGEYHCLKIWRWNDAPGRTHAEVMAAFGRAIDLAEADEAAALDPRPALELIEA